MVRVSVPKRTCGGAGFTRHLQHQSAKGVGSGRGADENRACAPFGTTLAHIPVDGHKTMLNECTSSPKEQGEKIILEQILRKQSESVTRWWRRGGGGEKARRALRRIAQPMYALGAACRHLRRHGRRRRRRRRHGHGGLRCYPAGFLYETSGAFYMTRSCRCSRAARR